MLRIKSDGTMLTWHAPNPDTFAAIATALIHWDSYSITGVNATVFADGLRLVVIDFAQHKLDTISCSMQTAAEFALRAWFSGDWRVTMNHKPISKALQAVLSKMQTTPFF